MNMYRLNDSTYYTRIQPQPLRCLTCIVLCMCFPDLADVLSSFSPCCVSPCPDYWLQFPPGSGSTVFSSSSKVPSRYPCTTVFMSWASFIFHIIIFKSFYSNVVKTDFTVLLINAVRRFSHIFH